MRRRVRRRITVGDIEGHLEREEIPHLIPAWRGVVRGYTEQERGVYERIQQGSRRLRRRGRNVNEREESSRGNSSDDVNQGQDQDALGANDEDGDDDEGFDVADNGQEQQQQQQQQERFPGREYEELPDEDVEAERVRAFERQLSHQVYWRDFMQDLQDAGILVPPAAGSMFYNETNLVLDLKAWRELVQLVEYDEAARAAAGLPGSPYLSNSPSAYIRIQHAVWVFLYYGKNTARCVLEDELYALEVPMEHVANLTVSVMMYIFQFCQNLPPNAAGKFLDVFGSVGSPFFNPPPPLIVLMNESDHFLLYQNEVSMRSITRLFFNTMKLFRRVYNDNEDPRSPVAEYWDDRDSGEVILLQNGPPITFVLTCRDAMVHHVGSKWTPALEEALKAEFPKGGIACVRNETDSLCLLYAIAMGIVLLKLRNFFSTNNRFIDVDALSYRIHCLMGPDFENSRRILRAIRDRVPGDLCDAIERARARRYTTRELCVIMKKIEDEFIDEEFALDVYALNVGSPSIPHKVYPCYISRRTTAQRINIANISFGEMYHYCVFTNLREVFSRTRGKIFYTCSKCHQTFYTMNVLGKHPCVGSDVSDYSWNRVDVPDGTRSAGVCEKCHLKFDVPEEYEYHRHHCFMAHRSGSRYVKLSEKEELCGGGAEGEEEDSLADRKLLFADFESCIKEDGFHEVMSYGLYDVEGHQYIHGYCLEDFMDVVLQISKRHKEIHVYFHNAMNYDANFILRYVLERHVDWSISVIMKSSTKLQTIKFLYMDGKTQRRIRIGDTYHFMTMSLSRIVNSIRKDDVEANMRAFPLFFETFHTEYPGVANAEIDRVLYKNVFPYKFFVRPECLDTPLSAFRMIFEPREENLAYFSEGVTVQELAENLPQFDYICRTFGVRDARGYHDVYLLCDVMQITDVFLKARESLMETHHIDIAKYIGMPGASWHAFLKLSPDMRLPLYRNTKFAEFFAHMTRGGVTSAPLRYAVADETHSILYLDVNGLYPYVMQQYKYPQGKMEWMVFRDIKGGLEEYLQQYFFPLLEASGRGACLCVDLGVPDWLKEKTDQFPFAPEHRVLKDEYYDEGGVMYPYLRRWSEANGGARMQAFVGLVGTLYDKKEYGVHWQLLKWYIEHGMRVTKLHFAVIFDEGDYLKNYVSLNISIRNTRTDELGKMVYKLLGNSIYGKTFESPFNRGKYLIIRNREKLTGLLEEGNVSLITPIDHENCVVKMDAEDVVLDKPTYIGACVTEYAKLHMYKLFYDQLGSVFPGVELVYTDTDSFIVRVEHRAGMTSPELFKYIEEKCPGMIGNIGGQVKSETGDDTIAEVVALRSKLYAYVTKHGKIGKRAKGTTAAAQDTELSWETYKQALFDLKAVPTHNMQFQRSGFQIRTVEMVRQSISVNDGKRYICEDGIHTHAWGFNN